MDRSGSPRPLLTVLGVVLLLAVLGLQLVDGSRRNSITWDEGHHLYAGYETLEHSDFGLNPEVPPLVKNVAAAPLLAMRLIEPQQQGRSFKDEAFFGGRDFVFQNDADTVLFRARMAASLFTFALALLIFAAARQMFSTTAAFIALGFFVFDPNVLAHGALVTTDIGSACTLFAVIYAFYRWRLAPSWKRLVLAGLACGLCLVTKFTGVLIVPMIAVLAWCEWAFPNYLAAYGSLNWQRRRDIRRQMLIGLPVIGGMAYAVLWAFYQFRYAARPEGLTLNPAFAAYVPRLNSHFSAQTIQLLGTLQLFPESWLYGLADTKITADSYTSYFCGHVYPHGNFLYFPVAFLIKSTLPFLVLLVLAIPLIVIGWVHARREVLYLTFPPLLYFLVACTSNMNIGARHLLPMYPFLYVLAAGAFCALLHSNRQWLWVPLLLVGWQAADAFSMYPAYMAFGNSLWGGPSQVHLYLSDANVDWGQQLNDVRAYLASRGLRDTSWSDESSGSGVLDMLPSGQPPAAPSAPRAKSCWFVYFPDGVVDPPDYGVPCHRLPTADTLWWMHETSDVPAEIDGPVLISDSDLAGIEFGEGPLNPYEQFQRIQPTAVIDHGVYVFDGHFSIPLAAGLNAAEEANNLLKGNRPKEALVRAQHGVALAPTLVNTQVALGDAYAAEHRPGDARLCYERALKLAQTVEPELQTSWIPALRAKLQPE
ncbi:MAG TPA: glycosyltransferase family 39 protein [Acidobacteriaceae bacterium]|nr:glycosyltransferase family 39 protein [Acidobacteriaceae bacterium]